MLTVFTQSLFAAPSIEYELDIGKLKFVIPAFSEEYMERESTIAPEEFELAERFKTLLDEENTEAVITELNNMFDLEMSPAMLHLKAQVYFDVGELKRAENTFKLVLLRKPQMIRAHSDIGTLYLSQERFKEAQHHFAKAISYGEKSPTVYGQLGYLNLRLNNAHSAIMAYQNALMLEPDNKQWQQGLLSAYSQAKIFDAALSLGEELIKVASQNHSLWLTLAYLYIQKGDDVQALSSMEMAYLLGDREAKNLLASAQLHIKLNSYDRAIALLDNYVDDPSYNKGLVDQVILYLVQNKRWTDAERLLAVYDPLFDSFNSSDKSAYYNQAAIIAKGKKNLNQSGELFKKALDADPTNEHALIEAAQYYHELKDYNQAEILYTRAEAIPNTTKQAILGKAQIYIDIKDYEAALGLLRLAYRNYPELIELKDNIAALEEIITATQQS